MGISEKEDLPVPDKYLINRAKIWNYHISQLNGQRVFGPPKDELTRNLGYEHELCITNIPPYCYEDTLLDSFFEVDGLYSFRYMIDFQGRGRGFAFVNYLSVGNADFARRKMDWKVVMGNCLRVVSAKRNSIISIGNLDMRKIDDFGGPEDAVLNYCLAEFGAIRNVIIKRLMSGLMVYCIEFYEHREAAFSRRQLNTSRSIFGSKCFVCWESQIYHPTMLYL